MVMLIVEGVTDDYQSMTIEKVSEEEHSQVEVLKTGRQTVFEERITRVEETEREVIEEKAIRKFTHLLRRFYQNIYYFQSRERLSFGDCLEDKIENCQNCSMLY